MSIQAPFFGSDERAGDQVLRVLCPRCRGRVRLSNDLQSCPHCLSMLRDPLGMLDFVQAKERGAEKAFYDQSYSATELAGRAKRSIRTVAPRWVVPDSPENAVVLERVGDLAGKVVLLLGNGQSVKELAFLEMEPKQIVYSDLSSRALLNIQAGFELSDYDERLTFAAVDALDLPL